MTIRDEAVEAAVRRYHQTGLECSPDAMRVALEAALPHLSPPSGEVGEAEKRMTELVQIIDSGAIPGISTPVLRGDLVTLLAALASERERAERAERERDDCENSMRRYWAMLGHPATDPIHDALKLAEFLLALALECARTKAAREAAMFDLADAAEARAQAAEAKVKEAAELLDTFGRMLNEDHDNLPDELVVSLTYDDTAYDDDLGGPNTLLGELFLRVFRNARSSALRWTETQGEGE